MSDHDAVPVVAVTDEMVATYLRANDAYWTRVDGLPTALGEWRAGTPKEATRESLAAVLRDHIATVAALQAENERWAKDANAKDDAIRERDEARDLVASLQARHVPEGEVHFIQGGKLVGKIINVGSQPDTSKEQPKEQP